MSEDRLDKALEEMKREDVDDGTLDSARARVWERLTNTAGAGCAEFRPDFPTYLSGGLADTRRVLMEDHLGRCAACRTVLADMKGDRRVVAMPRRSTAHLVRWGTLTAAAALILIGVYLGRDAIDTMLAPGGPRATFVSVTGGVYRLSEGTLTAGSSIGEREMVRTGPGAHAVLRLADGSTVDVNERTELFVTAAWSGAAIHLQRGDVIVKAAKQRRGELRVLTRDSIASVKGTVFAVSAGMGGSVVSVVEGAVAVNQPGHDLVLIPGQQAASNPSLATSVAAAVSWSPEAEEYLQLLASFAKIERQLQLPADVRTNSALLSSVPAGAFVYGAVPNVGGQIGQALGLAEQQAFKSGVFRKWWNSGTGMELRRLVERMQSVSSLVGNEIVFTASAVGRGEPVPMVMARVQSGKGAALADALKGLFPGTGGPLPAYSVSDDLMVVSDTPSNLTWVRGQLGKGAGSPFAAAIADRYRRGAGWLLGMDAAAFVALAAGDDAPPVELASMIGMKYVFLEQRAPAGAEENEVTLVFEGERKGMGAWLANAGSGGAAEYLPADALAAIYVSTRQPSQLLQEFLALLAKEPGADVVRIQQLFTNLAAALGTEAAFALTGFSVSGPTWVMAAVANNPPVIDSSLQKLVETINAELGPKDQDKRLVFAQEGAGGRVWSSIKGAGLPFGVTWAYDGGYMVMGSDRASAERAIATRNGGAALVWSSQFRGLLPASAGIHPSAFGWLNTKGALGAFSAFVSSPALSELMNERDPILVVFNGTPNQIHAASRARLTGAIMNVMLLESLSGAVGGS